MRSLEVVPMDRDFRRRHWKLLALAALCSSLVGCAQVPVASGDGDAEAGAQALVSGADAAPAPAPAVTAAPSAGKRASRAAWTVRSAPESHLPPQPSAAAPAEGAGETADANPEFALVPSRDSDQQGMASWYGPGLHGRLTASGERFDKQEFTAAHRSFAFGSRVCVRSAATGKTVVVRINDRGPFSPGRVIDLSQAAAQELGLVGLGIKPVELWQLDDSEEECPETLVTAEKAEAMKKRQAQQTQVQAQAQSKAPPPARSVAQARNQPRPRALTKAPAPKARVVVASRPPAKPAARATSVTSATTVAQSVR